VPQPKALSKGAEEEEEYRRKVAQSILGDLHLVQKLINMLPARVKEHGAREGGKEDTTTSFTGTGHKPDVSPIEEGHGGLPLSTNLLEQLDVDLHNRVWALSTKMVNILRRG
jgi:hypothetical protein